MEYLKHFKCKERKTLNLKTKLLTYLFSHLIKFSRDLYCLLYYMYCLLELKLLSYFTVRKQTIGHARYEFLILKGYTSTLST